MKLKKFINGFTVDFSTKHRIKFYAEWNGSPVVHLFIWDKNVKSLKPYDKYYLINHFNNINETLEFLKQKSKINFKQEVVLKLLKLEKEILDKNSGIVNVSEDALINTN
jgi:predicted metal-binding protein